MLDIKWIRENREDFDEMLSKRHVIIDTDRLFALDEERRWVLTLIQQFQQSKNVKTKKLAGLPEKSGKDFEDLKKDVAHINEKLDELSAQIHDNNELEKMLETIPNILDSDVPYGNDETDNKFIRDFKKPNYLEWAKEHFSLGHDLGMMDFEQTAKISGSRFVTLIGDLARLERALINFMIDQHVKNFQFKEISPPSLVRPKSMYNVGQLPKFSDDSYATEDGKYRLIPTGEVPLTNMVFDSISQISELPKRFVAYTECFRSEAGSAGKDTRGMIRNHQFGKVELVTVTTKEKSNSEHEYMLCAAEEILKKLDIPYRVMLLCSRDIGFSAKKTYDIEVWLPGQKKYREISSISNCGDFQARRMRARYRTNNTKENSFVHTLNGSGLAVGRTIIAIMENYQNEDGSIDVPDILVPYMSGMTKIARYT